MGMARHEDFAICKNRSTLVTYWRFCRACETEAALTGSKLIRVKRIMGSRTAEDKQSILIGMEEDLGECILSLPPETAIPLALTALNAKEKFNNADIKISDTPDKIEALQCNNWEIRHYPDTSQILFSFRHTTGVWIRAVLPLKTASEIKKALELVEAPRKKKAIPRKRQN